MKVAEKLAIDAFKNDKESHIWLDQKICHTCRERFCVYARPGNLSLIHRFFARGENNEVQDH